MSNKKNPPLVSIITPAYNQADYLDETIKSVLAQTYQNIEYIVIDDGSTDHTREVLERWEGTITCLSQKNMGQANTLNKGWQIAKGELVGYLSSDDLLDKHAIERLVNAYDEGDAVIFGRYRLIDPAGAVIKSKRIPFRGYRDMVEGFNCPIGVGALFSRSLLETCGGWNAEYRQIPDYDFWIRVGVRAKFVYVDQELASFRVHTGSQTFASSTVAKADESIKSIDALFSAASCVEGSQERKAKAAAFVFSCCLHMRSGRTGLAWQRFLAAASVGGLNAVSWHNLKRIIGTLVSTARYKYINKA